MGDVGKSLLFDMQVTRVIPMTSYWLNVHMTACASIAYDFNFTLHRVANVRHSHVILTIRNTHIFSKQPSTQVEKLIRVSRIHYIAKNGTAQLPLIGF